MDKQSEAQQIADAIGGRIDKHTMEDGTRVFSIETDDHAASGSGMSDDEAWGDLVAKANEIGWRLEE